MDQQEEFRRSVARNIATIGEDSDFIGFSNVWLREAVRRSYVYNFNWLDRTNIQLPSDMYAIQELIWRVKPDLVIETGVAHGGSLVLSASMLAMIDYCEAAEAGVPLDPRSGKRKVIGIDIDIRPHNRSGIESHPLAHKIELLQGSSVDPAIVEKVKSAAAQAERVIVFLDSNHTHDHVLAELAAYAPMVTKGSYIVVWDTGIEDLPKDMCEGRPWGKGNSPKTAVWEYLGRLRETEHLGSDGRSLDFEMDKTIEHKIVVTAGPDGFLRRL
jgi:cephalosporin hydroxylase